MNAALLRRVILPAWQYARGQNGMPLLRYLDRTQWLSRGELEDLQWRRIGELLEHAYAHVPYYADIMRRAGVNPDVLIRDRSLKRLPLLERAIVHERRNDLRATNIAPERFVANGTGGSTGEPMRFFDDRAGFGWGTAAVWRAQGWLGVDIGDRCAYLWGADFDVSSFRGFRGRVKSGLLNMLMLPAWELSAEIAPRFFDQLVKFRPRLLLAYAGAAHEMARLLGPDRAAIPGLQAVVVSAELLTDDARACIEACFKVPVYNRYGGRDLKFIAQECPARQGLHINAESVLVEIVHDGRRAEPGEAGEIVITRLDNFAMPFVRYRTGDLATLGERPCDCGRSLPLLQKLEGRMQDAIRTADGRVISGLLFAHMFKDCDDVRLFQIHQLTVDQLLIQIVLSPGAGFTSRGRVERLVRQLVGAAMRIEFELREEIPLARSGKRRILISHLAAQPLSGSVVAGVDGPSKPALPSVGVTR